MAFFEAPFDRRSVPHLADECSGYGPSFRGRTPKLGGYRSRHHGTAAGRPASDRIRLRIQPIDSPWHQLGRKRRLPPCCRSAFSATGFDATMHSAASVSFSRTASKHSRSLAVNTWGISRCNFIDSGISSSYTDRPSGLSTTSARRPSPPTDIRNSSFFSKRCVINAETRARSRCVLFASSEETSGPARRALRSNAIPAASCHSAPHTAEPQALSNWRGVSVSG